MTFVGKILVIFILIFALFFLALNTVVFTTQKNWKDEAAALQTQIQDLTSQKNDLQALADKSKTDLQSVTDEFEQNKSALELQLTSLQSQLDLSEKQLSEQQTALSEAQEAVRASLNQAEARNAETDKLKTLLAAVQKQANEYKMTQLELTQRISDLERMLETATGNNQDLLERTALLSGELRRAGLSDDITRIRGVASDVPDDVEGYVKRVDERNSRVELSIGSDDGLVPGHILELFRREPIPEYLGQIRVEVVDPDQAVGVVVGKTINGKKIQEGDIVASQIRPRS